MRPIELQNTVRASTLRLGLLLALGLAAIAGCKSSNKALSTAGLAAPREVSGSKLSAVELREKLGAFYVEFVNVVEAATSDAAAKTTDLDLRRRLVEGRIRAVRACRQAVFQRRPMAAFLDTWGLCIQMELMLNSSEGHERFGEAQPAILKASQTLRSSMRQLGAFFLKSDQLTEVEGQLREYARTHPLSTSSDTISMPSAEVGGSGPQFGWLIELPLSPFRAFQGVDQTAAAIHELTFVATAFSQNAGEMPRELAWETELLLMRTRRELEGMFNDLDRKQTNTQVTLTLLRGAITDAERTIKATTEASVALDTTLKTFTQLMRELSPPTPPDQPKPQSEPGRPFDILDYARTAEQIGVTATNLNELLVQVQRTVETNALTERIRETQSSAESAIRIAQVSARDLANHIAWLAVLVILVFFGALTVYRILAAKARRKNPEGSPGT